MLLGLFLICLTYIECNHDSKNTAINPKMEMESQDTFYCPMHPEIVQNHPGKCPKPECEGMDLVKKFRPDLLHALLKPVNYNGVYPNDKIVVISVAEQIGLVISALNNNLSYNCLNNNYE